MHSHMWRQEPLHGLVGRPNETQPALQFLCGHVDQETNEVCILSASDHGASLSIHAKLMGPEMSAQCHAKVACGEPGDVHTNLAWWLNEVEKDAVLALIRRAALVTRTEPNEHDEWPAMDDLKAIVSVIKGQVQ